MGASSRVRFYQYLPYFESRGFKITVAPFFDDDYITSLYSNSKRVSLFRIAAWYLRRIRFLLSARQYDLLWVEKELLPWVPAWIEGSLLSRRTKIVVDYDDAVFHRYDRHSRFFVRALLRYKIDEVMRKADLVIAGNEYIAQRAQKAGAAHVEIIPTVVDLEHYSCSSSEHDGPLVVGWIGTPGTSHYLRIIAKALSKIVERRIGTVVAIGAGSNPVPGVPVQVIPWREETEVDEIQRIDVGIMPLPDLSWERGKCGYKLIQYMACGKPVVASPIGVNAKIIDQGVNGFLADTEKEWIEALEALYQDPLLRQRMGSEGRKRVEALYSLQVTAPKLEALLNSTVMA